MCQNRRNLETFHSYAFIESYPFGIEMHQFSRCCKEVWNAWKIISFIVFSSTMIKISLLQVVNY